MTLFTVTSDAQCVDTKRTHLQYKNINNNNDSNHNHSHRRNDSRNGSSNNKICRYKNSSLPTTTISAQSDQSTAAPVTAPQQLFQRYRLYLYTGYIYIPASSTISWSSSGGRRPQSLCQPVAITTKSTCSTIVPSLSSIAATQNNLFASFIA